MRGPRMAANGRSEARHRSRRLSAVSVLRRLALMLTPSLLSDAPGARIFLTSAAPLEWMWTLAYGQNEDRTPTHGYAATREAATRRRREFKSWDRLS